MAREPSIDSVRRDGRVAASSRSARERPCCVAAQEARALELARLLPLWPDEIADRSAAGRTRLVAALRRSLRAERQRGLSGHWTYSVSRHAALSRAYVQEVAALRRMGPTARHGDLDGELTMAKGRVRQVQPCDDDGARAIRARRPPRPCRS